MQATTTNPVMMAPWTHESRARWIHALAVLTVLAAFPLLFLGAEVTTKGVGMADQRSVVNPLAAVAEMIGGQQTGGWIIEHSHRLAGWFVGFCGILLAAALWLGESRRWLQWLGTAALLLIIIQGVLGIFRVQLNALLGPTLAWVHGSFAPIVLATLASVALCTSRAWSVRTDIVKPQAAGALRRWSLTMVALVYLQLVLGGMVRHQGTALAARGHLLGAFVVTAGLLWLIRLAWDVDPCRWAVRILLGLLGVQTLLGVESWFSWMNRYFVPSAAYAESTALHFLRSSHYVLGAMILANTVVLMLQVHRHAPAGEASA